MLGIHSSTCWIEPETPGFSVVMPPLHQVGSHLVGQSVGSNSIATLSTLNGRERVSSWSNPKPTAQAHLFNGIKVHATTDTNVPEALGEAGD